MTLLDPRLQAFIAVVQNQTVHGAARAIGLTQTAVTQRIQGLERQLGATLFVRSRRGMSLTPEGESLRRYCLAANDLEGIALSQITRSGLAAPVRVTLSGPTSMMTSRVIPACIPLFKRFPSLLLNFEVEDSESRISQLRQGLAQLVIVPPEEVTNEMDSKTLKADRYLLVGSPAWKHRKIEEIVSTEKVIDFCESDPTTLKYLKKAGLLPNSGSASKRERLFCNSNEAIVRLFSSGIGYGTLTEEVAKPYLERGEITMLNPRSLLEDIQALVWYPRPEMPPYFSAILQAIK